MSSDKRLLGLGKRVETVFYLMQKTERGLEKFGRVCGERETNEGKSGTKTIPR